MARLVPPFLLIIICIAVFALWQMHVYPFSDPIFAYDGYGMHVFGGIGYTAFLVLTVQLCFPHLLLTRRFFLVQGLSAFFFLLALELLQFDDPFRHVQLEDVIAQTAGIILALVFLSFMEARKKK